MNKEKNPDKKNTNENLGDSLVTSISKAGAVDIAADAAEIALDSLLDEGLLKEVPVFGWLVKGYTTVNSVRDRIFLKKVAMFLSGTREISEQHRLQFLETISSKPEFSKKTGEALVLLLERHEDFEKSQILGRAFARYIRGEIDFELFLKMAKAIDLAFIGDLRNLAEYYKRISSYDPKQGKSFTEYLDDETSQSLYTSGLIRSQGYIQDIYHPNDIGEELLLCINATQPA